MHFATGAIPALGNVSGTMTGDLLTLISTAGGLVLGALVLDQLTARPAPIPVRADDRDSAPPSDSEADPT